MLVIDPSQCVLNFLLLRQQSNYVLKFLVGLNDSYASIRSQLLLTIHLPSIVKVFSLLLQEESQRQLSNTTSTITHGLLAKQSFQSTQNIQSKYSKEKSKKPSLHCTHYGYNGHTIDKCFQLHDYPPRWTGIKGKRVFPSGYAAISTKEVYIQNSNENSRFSLMTEEFNKLLTFANFNPFLHTTTPSTIVVNLVTTSQFFRYSFHSLQYYLFKVNF